MSNALAVLVASASLAQAGVVGGVALEQLSGIPLARARIRLDRVDVTGRVQSETVIAGRAGQFTFSSVPDGWYVLTASRDGYAPIAFGQRRPQGTGPPFPVNKETNLFAELRLRKLGVFTGRVFDENRIGIRHVGVSAYSLKPPFRAAASAETDDRGIYRIHGLAEGKYRVRSEPFRHDDGLTLLPTFAPEMLIPRDSLIAAARLDVEAADLDVTPIAGELMAVGGSVSCAPLAAGAITVTISTDTGRWQARTGCAGSYLFENLAPGHYEVFAEDEGPRLAAFVEQRIFANTKNLNLELRPVAMVEIALRDETGRTPVRGVPATLTLRRVDAAGVTETKTLPIEEHARLPLPPGWWEAAARLPVPHHLMGVGASWRPSEPRPTADPDWFEFSVSISNYQTVALRTAKQAGGLDGKVLEKQSAVAGIPVFLWPVAAGTRRSAGGPRRVFTNLAGAFRFEGLPPGEYRLLASFDFDEVDEEILGAANADLFRVEAGGVTPAELSPYLAP